MSDSLSALFPGLPLLQFLITYGIHCLQYCIQQVIKNWRQRRNSWGEGNEGMGEEEGGQQQLGETVTHAALTQASHLLVSACFLDQLI